MFTGCVSCFSPCESINFLHCIKEDKWLWFLIFLCLNPPKIQASASLPSSPPFYYLSFLSSFCLKCTNWPQCLNLFFPVPNLFFPLLLTSPSHLLSFFLWILFLAVSWGAEANEGWLRLLWLLQRHWLHGWLQWRLRAAVSPAACASGRWPKFQQCAHALRVRIVTNREKKKVPHSVHWLEHQVIHMNCC